MYSVVIIDDNKIAVEAIAKVTDWEKCGCEVVGTAFDGITGLKLIQDASPAIVIIDIQMPGFNGLDIILKTKTEIFVLLSYPDTVSLNMPARPFATVSMTIC